MQAGNARRAKNVPDPLCAALLAHVHIRQFIQAHLRTLHQPRAGMASSNTFLMYFFLCYKLLNTQIHRGVGVQGI